MAQLPPRPPRPLPELTDAMRTWVALGLRHLEREANGLDPYGYGDGRGLDC